MGFKNVAHVEEGFDALKKVDLKLLKRRKNKLFASLFQNKFDPILAPKILLFTTKVGAPKIPFV